jgi:drug/metabolite transporter (DMT)-like permease
VASGGTSRARRYIPLLCLAGAVLFWGTSFVATKTALDSFEPMTAIGLRMAVASLVLAPWWLKIPRPRYERGDWKLLALLVALQPCLYYLFEGYAVRYTTSSQAGIVSAVVPLLVAAGAWMLLKERLSARGLVAIVVSLAGVAVLSLAGTAQASAPNPALGNLLELLAMVCAAAYMLVVRRLSGRYSPWLITGIQGLAGAVFFLPGVLASNLARVLAAPPSAWASIAYLGIFVTLGAFGLYNTAVAAMPASRAALSINLVPPVAMIAGWLVRGEGLSPLQLAACAVVVGAVVVGESGSEPETAEEEVVEPA